MQPSERYDIILQMLDNQDLVTVSELMKEFNVSIETVRRDLEYLEQQGILRRVYGGAVLNVAIGSEPEYANRSQFKFREKNAIAATAAELIAPDESIYLGVGTTVQAMTQ